MIIWQYSSGALRRFGFRPISAGVQGLGECLMEQGTRLSAPMESARRRRLVGSEIERCIYCRGKSIRREGLRQNKYETIQLWYCKACDRVFTPRRAKGRTYPLKIILESLMLYYRGATREATIKTIRERFGLAVPPRTLSSWIADYRDLTAYARMRDAARAGFLPHRLVRSVRLHHRQVYRYCLHQGKLRALLAMPEHAAYAPVAAYLYDMLSDCPHSLFVTEDRASQGKMPFDLAGAPITAKHNHACRIADLVLQTVTVNKRRHDEIQRFMLLTDSVTVAVEVPIYLTPDDIAALRAIPGFDIPISGDATLTGHIDVLQSRSGPSIRGSAARSMLSRWRSRRRPVST